MGNIIIGVGWNTWEWSGDTEESAESHSGGDQGHSDNKQELQRHSGRFSPVALL